MLRYSLKDSRPHVDRPLAGRICLEMCDGVEEISTSVAHFWFDPGVMRAVG